MNKALMVLGWVFLGVLIVGGSVFAVVAFNAAILDKESKAFVEEVTAAVCSEMKAETFVRYASDEMLVSSKQDVERTFTIYKKLGKFIKVYELIGQGGKSYTTWDYKYVSAKYLVKVEFETGPAQVDIGVVKKDKKWKIEFFEINSPAILQQSFVENETRGMLRGKDNVDIYELSRDVGRLLHGDEVQLRRDIQKVISLAMIRENEGKKEEAVKIYERVLEVNAANVPIQMKLAVLLAGQGKISDSAAKAKIVQELAEHEDLILSTETLLKSMGYNTAVPIDKEENGSDVQIVLVPVGKVSRRVLSALRDKLEARMEISFAISQKEFNLGKPDRSGKVVFVNDTFKNLKQSIGDNKVVELLRVLSMTSEAVESYDNKLKYIYAAFRHAGPDGNRLKMEFDAALAKSDSQVQYDVGRLLNEMKSEFPIRGALVQRDT